MDIYTSSSSDDSTSESEEKLIIEPKKPLIKLKRETRLNWPNDDLYELLERISQTSPELDPLKWSIRARKINWDEIKFNNHSSEDCKEVWKQLQKPIRKVKTFEEVASEVEQKINSIPEPQECRYLEHPEKPKKYLTAYQIFCHEHREKNLKENPGTKQKIASRQLSEMFSQLTDAERSVYHAQEEENKKKWVEKMKQFHIKYPSESKKTKPLSPFELYYESQLKANIDKTEKISKNACKEIWKNLEDVKKIEFINLAKHNEDNYLKDPANVEKKEKYKSVLTQADHRLIDKSFGKPIKPPPSGYSLFTQEVLKKTKSNTKGELKGVGNQWSNLGSEEKADYNARSKQMNEEYDKQYKAYFQLLPEDKKAKELLTIKSRKRKILCENMDQPQEIKRKRKDESVKEENDRMEIINGDATKTSLANESTSIHTKKESNSENDDSSSSSGSSSDDSSSEDDSSSSSS